MIFQKSLRLFPFVWPALVASLLSLVGCVHPPQSKIPVFSGPLVAPELVTGAAIPTNVLWQPMRGSPPATVLAGRERRALRLPCNFATSQVERVSWDRVVQLDMSACRGVRFDLLCPDRAPVAHFNLYLRSGAGWYSGSFQPSRKGGWSSVVVSRDSMRTEGQPAGWTQIDGLRISAWRGSATNTEFFIANLALAGADAPIVIVRADSAPADEAKTVAEFVTGMRTIRLSRLRREAARVLQPAQGTGAVRWHRSRCACEGQAGRALRQHPRDRGRAAWPTRAGWPGLVEYPP
jgi:hypothetical protein